MKNKFKTIITIISRKILYNERLIYYTKSLLYNFPELDENVRVLAYKFKRAGKINNHSLQDDYFISPINNKEPSPQFLFDISELILRDVHTGIQRVVRSLLFEFYHNTPSGYIFRLVRSNADGNLVYANKYHAETFCDDTLEIVDKPLQVTPGDIFYCGDLSLSFPFYALQKLRNEGVRVIFTIYDLFAVNLDTMPKAYRFAFSDWLSDLLMVTDAIVCDSKSVANELHEWLLIHKNARNRPLKIGFFHLGADLLFSNSTENPTPEDSPLLKRLQEQNTLLMVGTVEPRKGHASALEAIERLWNEGIQINLVIVGKEGWRSHDLVRRLRRHPQRNKQLFWLEKASDALLVQLYAQSTALLAASFAEGFGLPLIEAAHYGLPIIARDIPVFHEVAGDFAFYFPNTDSIALADSLRQWLRLHAEGKAPQSKDMPYLTWAQSTQQLLKVILEDNWYTVYQPADENKTTHTEQ